MADNERVEAIQDAIIKRMPATLNDIGAALEPVLVQINDLNQELRDLRRDLDRVASHTDYDPSGYID